MILPILVSLWSDHALATTFPPETIVAQTFSLALSARPYLASKSARFASSVLPNNFSASRNFCVKAEPLSATRVQKLPALSASVIRHRFIRFLSGDICVQGVKADRHGNSFIMPAGSVTREACPKLATLSSYFHTNCSILACMKKGRKAAPDKARILWDASDAGICFGENMAGRLSFLQKRRSRDFSRLLFFPKVVLDQNL